MRGSLFKLGACCTSKSEILVFLLWHYASFFMWSYTLFSGFAQ